MKNILLSCFALFFMLSDILGFEWHREVDLRGKWRFEIGDDIRYADPEYDDSGWELIEAPGIWEDQGFPGYDGFAWYRKKFLLPENIKNNLLYLILGRIDDVDFVYVNGEFLNTSGAAPPEYRTAYNLPRAYLIPPMLLKYGQSNLIAVRVYDNELAGGIVDGQLGVYWRDDIRSLATDLSGYWKFSLGDDPNWANVEYDDSFWTSILVPAKWEPQGFENYDGYAWYRRELVLNKSHSDDRLILVLGKIDDIDEVYFNGRRIGRTGRFPAERYAERNNPYWNQDRFYSIPNSFIRWNEKNVIAVRVYDAWLDGGIYEGPIGIMSRRQWLDYRRKNKDFNKLMDNIFSRIFSN